MYCVSYHEHTYWGPETSNILDDPNPRLEAYIAAARRGAKVWVLLDSFFDDQDLDSPKSNLRTVEYLRSVAAAESLDLEAERRNPTGLAPQQADPGRDRWPGLGPGRQAERR